MEWLNRPATPKLIAGIFAIIITALLGPILAIFLIFGNTSQGMPLWSTSLFWGATAGLWIAGWRKSQTTALFCMTILTILPAIGIWTGASKMAFWPARLLIRDNISAEWITWLLTGLWAALILLALARIIGFDGKGLLALASGKKLSTMIPLIASFLFMVVVTILNAQFSIRNLAYAMADKTETIRLVVSEKSYQGRNIALTLANGSGHLQSLFLDDFYDREVGIFQKNSPNRQVAMRLPWNQVYCAGDILEADGRRSAMGFAIDRVTNVLSRKTKGEC